MNDEGFLTPPIMSGRRAPLFFVLSHQSVLWPLDLFVPFRTPLLTQHIGFDINCTFL